MMPTPARVAIVAMGPSNIQYIAHMAARGGRHAAFDEVWAINAMAGVIDCDRVFAMDPVQYLANGEGPLFGYKAWMRSIAVPVYSAEPDPKLCPASIPYPLEFVIQHVPFAYFDNSAAYAVGFAVALGVKELALFGLDFTYPDLHQGEKGRACVEYLLGLGIARGMLVDIAAGSTLMNTAGGPRFYGYGDRISIEPDGRLTIREPGPALPVPAED